jgi:TolB-like protein
MAEALRSLRQIEDTGETRAHAITRLIVLPFRVLRPDPDTDFLAVSLPDAITGALAGLGTLVVRSSAVAARFAGNEMDFRRLAAEADIDVALTGTLLRAGQQVRVTAQLVEAREGTVVWTHAPHAALRDVFQLQDQLVDLIVASLSLSLTACEHRTLKVDVPASPTAYEYFLRGNQLILTQGVTNAEHLHVARAFYERCLAEDPRYAPGWARLGRCYWLIGKGGDAPDEPIRRAEAGFQRALELNPELPLALNLRALLEIDQGRTDEAILQMREIEQAKLTDFFRDFVLMHRTLLEGGREESLGAAERLLARRLDPETLWQVARVFAYFGERARALGLFGLSLERGFIVYRILTCDDPWLDALRPSHEFRDLVQRARSRYVGASAAFRDAGGEQLLGVTLPIPPAVL